MAELAVVGVVALVLVARGFHKTARSRLKAHGWHVLAGRWLTGQPWHGKPVTDAGWFRHGQKALTPTGHATRWAHLPRWRRAMHRTGGTLAVLAALLLLFKYPQVMGLTLLIFGVLTALTGAALLVLSLFGRGRRRRWLLPLHHAAHGRVGVPRAARASSWIHVELGEGKAVTGVRLSLPQGWPADPADEKWLVNTVSAKTGIESPEATWRRGGPKPMLTITRSEPAPGLVKLADIRTAVDTARSHELVWGIGKRGGLVKTSLDSDSPHIGLSIGSGGGKSMTARALAAQRAYRGDIIVILDVKLISHMWAKDLPNVVIARWPEEIHRILLWLGDEEHGEVTRRNKVALAGADLEGNVHAVVGPRIFVVCEELNATMKALRRYWEKIRGDDSPRRSPALDALDFVCYCGRQVLVNLVYIGQRLSVKAVGGEGDARESIGVIAFCRYTPSNWKMLAGDHPMPPKSLHPGRLQVVAGDVREVQAVKMTAIEARELALAGTVAQLPYNMPGARHVAGETYAEIPSTDLAVVSGTGTPRPRLTLSEAVAEGVVSCSIGALRKASQRKGFPQRRGLRGVAGEYDPAELAEWNAGRRS